MRKFPLSLAVLAAVALAGATAFAQDEAGPTVADLTFMVNNLWMMVATILVFIMNLGFATLETGLNRSKNAVNILFKNTAIPAIGVVTYAAVGFNLMYPGADYAGGFFGFAGFGIGTDEAGITSAYNAGYTYWTDFAFQAMFAATAATIVSGAVAERIKLLPFLLFSTVFVAVVYPIAGMWKWGGGWLNAAGFHDFAGSTLVHSVGGWAALAGIMVLGPRIGKFVNGKANPIAPHNFSLAVIGTFMLWFGWYGFNGGSVLTADAGAVSFVFVTTTLGAAAGLVSSMIVSWAIQRKPDLSMILNGTLAGLVGITAGADVLTPMTATLVGGIAGVLSVLAVFALDKLKLDDAVGAVPVHLVGGVWGTLAVGIFVADKSLVAQLTGVAAIGAFSFASAYALFFLLAKTIGLRVPAHEEILGLDLGEHGERAYHFGDDVSADVPPLTDSGEFVSPAAVPAE
jgi:Amt family ammonium transporter